MQQFSTKLVSRFGFTTDLDHFRGCVLSSTKRDVACPAGTRMIMLRLAPLPKVDF